MGWDGVERFAAEVDDLVAFDPATLDDEGLRAALLTLSRCANVLDAVLARFTGAFDDRKLHRADGWPSTKQWLQAYGRLSGPAATVRARAAGITRLLPSLAAAFDAGEVTREHVDRIALTAREVGDEVVEAAEEPLVAIAREHEPEAVREVCERLIDEVVRDQQRPAEEQYRRRGLTLTGGGEGRLWRLRGILDPETGTLLQTALDAFTKPPGPDDDRTPEQRRHDAFADLLGATLREGHAPLVAGVRPHLALLMPVRRYAKFHDHAPGASAAGAPSSSGTSSSGTSSSGTSSSAPGSSGTGSSATSAPGAAAPGNVPPGTEDGGPAVLDGYGVVPDGLAARLSCDAHLQQVWQHPDNGLPLRLGRAYRNTPPALRRALATRDPNCRWPGCRTPANWCDSHHLKEWMRHNGATNVDNLVNLCRYHHINVHERGWRLDRDPVNGWLTATRPDGTPYDLGPSQPRINGHAIRPPPP